ncbi:thioredoxin family protein [Litchfieldella xinjiangensis]|uniref:thioredoxin family protein n=1 Tax=Litchfieldella xinjiangensis TaxID=1166948 RepID=UPI00069461F1|nr:thioredoxin family protein [Halomonas xinjiangensis]
MSMQFTYKPVDLDHEQVKSLKGPTILEFGTQWCGFCQAAQPKLETALAQHGDIRHIKVEDGRGRRLGRAFRVKLWPTLVFLEDGEEVARVVRPGSTDSIKDALQRIAA